MVFEISRLRFHAGQDNTYCGAWTQILKNSERPYTYSDLMGLSGLAFRFRYGNGKTKTGFCPSSAIGEMPDEQKSLARRVGWQTRFEWQDVKDDADGIRGRLVAAIDGGRPVVCYPPVWNVGLVYGYEDEGRMLLVNDYLARECPSRIPLAELGPMREFLTGWQPPLPLREALREALAESVTNWHREKHDGGLAGREYWYGEAAFDAWLGDLEGYEELTDDERKGLRSVDGWLYHCLWDARKAAMSFLGDWSCAVPAVRDDLKRIADLYKAEAKVLEPLVEAKYAGEKGDGYLSLAERRQQIETLREARGLDGQAVLAIEAVLKQLR